MMATWGSLAASIIMLAAAVGSGFALLRLLGATPRAAEHFLYALVLGLGLQGTLLLGASVVGWMHPAALWAVLLLPAIPLYREFGQLRALAQRSLVALETVSAAERLALLGVVAVVSVVLFVGAVVPTTDWDSQMYHLRIPDQLLAAGRLHLPADGSHLAFLGLFQFLYLPLLAIGADAGPALLNALMTGVLGLTLLTAGHTLFSTRTGVLAAIVVWGSSSLLLVGATPRVDVALTAVLAIIHLAVLRCFDDGERWRLPVIAAMAGMALGMKYHAVPYAGMLALVFLWAAYSRGTDVRSLARTAAVGLLICAVVAAPWFIKNQVFFDAPLFPFYSPPRLVPFLAEIAGTVTVPAEVPKEALSSIGNSRESISLARLLLNPSSLTVELEARDYTRNPLFLLLPLALFYWRDRRILALLIPGVAYLTFTLAGFRVTNLRYLIPAIPMLALCAVEVTRRATLRLPNPRLIGLGLTLLAVVAAAPGLSTAATRLVSLPRAQVALGLWEPSSVMVREQAFAAARLADEITPSDAKLLMLFDARGYYFNRTVLQDNALTNWPILYVLGSTNNCLAGTGITHVLLNTLAPPYYARRGANLEKMYWQHFPEFAARCLEPIGEAEGEVLFSVRPSQQ